MNVFKVYLIAFSLAVVYFEFGLALKCHVCTSGEKYEGDECLNLKTDKFVMDCAAKSIETGLNYTMCRKLDQDVEGRHEIDRDCAVEGSGRCILRTGTKEIKLEYCECSGDLCNAATSTVFSSLTTIALPLLALLTALLRSL